MSKFVIDKSFNFAYGHRVWVQKLRTELCAKGDSGTKCRFPHGHEGLVKVFVEADTLNPQAMVMDFKELGFVKDFLDTNIDHKFILDRNDPIFSTMINGTIDTADYVEEDVDTGNCAVVTKEVLKISDDRQLLLQPAFMPGTDHIAGYSLGVESLEGPEREFFEGHFIVDFIPTSENLSRWLYHVVQAKLDAIGVSVNRIEWNETPKSRAVYAE